MKPAIFQSLKGYNAKRFVCDLLSGILVAIIALPLSIALGIQSGVTLQQGLLSAIIGGFIISLLSGSRFQIGGPSATFISFIIVYLGNAHIGLLGVQIATVMAGIILLLMAVLRIGGLIKYIPYPIVIGFTSGIGITLLIGQIKDFLGLNIVHSGNNIVDKVSTLLSNMNTLSWQTLFIGILTIAIIVVLPKINKRIPASFIAIIITTAITAVVGQFSDTNYGIDTINSTFGNIKAEFYFPDFKSIVNLNFGALIIPSFVIAFLASVEALFSCKVADGMTDTLTDPNAELMAQGTANIASALMGGLPVTGALARTAANIRSGATSSLSGIIQSAVLLIIFFVAMPLVGYIPMSALAGVLIIVSINMAKLRHFGRLTRFNVRDFLILAATFLLTVCKDLVFGVSGGLLVTLIVYLPQILKKSTFTVIDTAVSSAFRINTPIDNVDKLITVIRINGALTFINTHKLLRLININICAKSEILLDFNQVTNMDLSSVELLTKLSYKLSRSQQSILIIHAQARIMKQLVTGQQTFIS